LLVTGGAGFVGSHFVRSLLSGRYAGLAGASVTVLDALRLTGSLANLAAVDGHPRLAVVEGDVCDQALVDDVIPGHDVIVNFAAETHVDRSIESAMPFVLSNVVGTQTLLDAAVRYGTGRFVHVSTDEVYGSIDRGSWTEERPLSPNSPYAASKAASDLLVLACHRTHRLDVSITRGSNTYGPFQFPEKVIPLFVTNLLDGRSVPLYGDGRNVREWLHVDDHCMGVAAVLARGRAGEVYNVGGGTELTNRELTDRLLRACGAGWERVEHVADRKGHDRRYSLDCGKIMRELAYRPCVEFERGLADTVDWYSANRSWWGPLRAHAAT
jgi:dTDP-glucose 4,6-dehydratase